MLSCINALLRISVAALLFGAAQVHAVQGAAYPNTSSFGVPFDSSEEWYRHCMRVAHLPAPRLRADRPPKGTCRATDLYYQKRDQKNTTAAEWRQVQACARASGDDAVLMMLYANGFGQPRDLDRAIFHACRLDSAKAEMEGRVAYLASGAETADGQPFDLCDHVTSGYMGKVCTGLRATREQRAYNARLDRFVFTLPTAARASFARLRRAADLFARQAATEVDLSGTGGPGFALHHAAQRREEFVQAVLDAADGKIPHASAEEYARLDAQLNLQYRRVMTPPPGAAARSHIGNSTVARADVRAVERAWLAYCDAWTAYLAASRARVDPLSVRAMLTRQRLAQLSRL